MPYIHQKLKEVTSDLQAFAMSLTKNPVEAEDLYQETALRIFENEDKFVRGTNFLKWSTVIMRNIFINQYRKKKRRERLLDNVSDDSTLLVGDKVVYLHDALDAKVIERHIRQLPAQLSQAFFLYQKGYRYQEIADLTNAPLGTVKSRIFFARRRLREELKKLGLGIAS